MTSTSKTESTTTESNDNKNGKRRAQVPRKVMATAMEYIAAKVVLFSACQDHQKTAGIDNVRKLRLSFVPEGTKGGACTSLFLQVLYHDFKLRQEFNRRLNKDEFMIKTLTKQPSPITYGKVLTHMLRVCERNNYTQVPLLSSSRPLQMYKDPFQIVPDNFNNKAHKGTKRALIIGINYINTPYALLGCHNDCRNVIAFLKEVHDFEDAHITLLLDDPVTCDEDHLPTKKNILRSFSDFVMTCNEGDAVFVHYAGHGIAVPDQSGDEADGFDEALLPVDYMTTGEIFDDDIFRLLLIPMPKNVFVTALFDCCHSGTILDLPFEYSVDKPECDYDMVKFPHMRTVEEYRNRIAREKKTQDLQDPISVAKHSHIPVKHQPRGRSKTRRQAQDRVTEPSMHKRRAIKEEKRTTPVHEPRGCRLPRQKQTSLRDNNAHTPLSSQNNGFSIGNARAPLSPQNNGVSVGKLDTAYYAHAIGKTDTTSSVWKKVLSKPTASSFPPRSPTKKNIVNHNETHPNKTMKSHSSSGIPIKRKTHPNASPPEQGRSHQSRSLKRRSKSQPPHSNFSAKRSSQTSKTKSPLSFRRFFDSSTHPISRGKTRKKKWNMPGFAQKKAFQPGESSKVQQRQHVPIKEQEKKASRRLSPTKSRIPASQLPYPEKGRANPPKTHYHSPRSPRRGRHATARTDVSPPKFIEIPIL